MTDIVDIGPAVADRDGEDCVIVFRVNQRNKRVGDAEISGPDWMTAEMVYESLILLANRIKRNAHADAEVRRQGR